MSLILIDFIFTKEQMALLRRRKRRLPPTLRVQEVGSLSRLTFTTKTDVHLLFEV
ncbi:unnamed protein product [Brugia timori]|uniref:Uncharacterized protein n=1 Tax=Brugia timori TaxID=42155 RepID=A0A0R3QR01_9BILA|nr:unnamed protein product [Brugia timori]